MSLFGVALATHVVVAIVGVGMVGAIPILASSARRAGLEASRSAALFGPLFSVLRVSFALMVLSGVLVECGAGGAYHETTWFRGSFLLLVFAFFAQRRARAALAKGATADDGALRRVEAWGYAMCGAVAAIALLMTVRPF